jgi:hypothetical protein
MPDTTELFKTIDAGSGSGAAPSQVLDGGTTAVSGLLGLLGFAFKDSSGKAVLPQLTAAGRLPVDTDDYYGTPYKVNGSLAAGSVGSSVLVTGATITVALSQTFRKFGLICSCLQSSLFQVVYINDASGTPTTTVIGEAIVGPGAFTWSGDFPEWLLTTVGGTGVQKIEVHAQNFQVPSTLRATLSFMGIASP